MLRNAQKVKDEHMAELHNLVKTAPLDIIILKIMIPTSANHVESVIAIMEVPLKRRARKRQTQNVSAVENSFPRRVILPLANVKLDLD